MINPNIRCNTDPVHSLRNSSCNRQKTLIRTAAPCGLHQTSNAYKDETQQEASLENDRLSTMQLGPFALEKRMPQKLYDELMQGAPVQQVNRTTNNGLLIREVVVENRTSGIVPVLARLSELSPTVEQAYFCHPSVKHVSNRPGHNGFCGYLNIQMQISYLQGAKARGHRKFGPRIPGIVKLQGMIERAWAKGIYMNARTETGGVRERRVWIGALEASAIYTSMGVPHEITSFGMVDRAKILISDTSQDKTEDSRRGRAEGGKQAHDELLDFVESYFSQQCNDQGKVNTTLLAPIYLQQPGHSMTIVGLERHTDGRNLVVLDPADVPSMRILALVGQRRLQHISDCDAENLMRVYRRDVRHLGQFDTLS